MIVVSSCSCLLIHWSQQLSWEWRCSWSSADRRCSNYIWLINNSIANSGASYIRGLTLGVLGRCSVTLLVLKQNIFWRTRSILWLLMTRLFESLLEHQYLWHWWIQMSLSFTRLYFNYLYQLCVEKEGLKCEYIAKFFKLNSAWQGLRWATSPPRDQTKCLTFCR